MHLPQLIIDLTLILSAAAVFTLLFRKLRQPLVLGYLLAGMLIGPNFHLFPSVIDEQNVQHWAGIGVIFLLFSLGLEFSFKKLMRVGGSASVTTTIEVSFMLGLGYITGQLLGWTQMDSLFLGAILAISSTTIIIRAFDELGVKTKKFAGHVFGILIVEDLIAVVMMAVLSTLAISRSFSGTELVFSIVKLAFFLVLWFLGGIYFLPTLLRRVRQLLTDEMLLITSLALCLAMVMLAVWAGFSPALGAFVMGSLLSQTTQAERIERLSRGVKDLFGAVFFVSVGMLINPHFLLEYAGPILLISLVLVTGKTLSVSLGSLLSGQSLKHSLQSGMSLAQIGEFSFIIATLGQSLKVINPAIYPIAVAVSAITTFTTPYLIRFSEPLFNILISRTPEGILRSLSRYSSGAQAIRTEAEWKTIARTGLMQMIVYSVIIMGIILLVSRYVAPFISQYSDAAWIRIALTLLTLFILAPFLSALALKRHHGHALIRLWAYKLYKAPILMLRLCA